MVVGGLNSEGKPVDFEIVDLGARYYDYPFE